MIFNVRLTLDLPGPAKALELRDKVATFIRNDPQVDLVSWSAARETRWFRVVCVEVATSTGWAEVVEATDEAAARAMFPAPLIVADVQLLRGPISESS